MRAAARDLAADAVIVTTRQRGAISIATRAGISRDRAMALIPSFAALERDVGNRPIVSVRSLPDAPGAAATALAAAGYGSLISAPIEMGLRSIGAIHILRRDASLTDNEPLVRAYASHAGVTVAGSRRPQVVRPTPARVLEALDELPLALQSFDQLARHLDDALAPLFGRAMSGIMLWNGDRDVLQMVPGSFGADEPIAASYQIIGANGRSNAARVFATGDPYLSNRAVGDPAILQEYVRAFSIERLLSVRLERRGHRVGVLHLANKPTDYTVADVWRLEPLIPRIATAVETAGVLFQLRRRRRLEQILADVAVAIASGQSMRRFLSPALDELSDALEASLVTLLPVNADPIVWRARPIANDLERQLLARASLQPPLRADIVGPSRAGDPGSSALHVPVHLGSQRVGTLSALRLRAEPFATDERGALTRLAKLAALAWATERYQQQRAELARIEERQRIADDLHDDVAQILFGAQMALDTTLELETLGAVTAENIVHARALLIKADEALRSVIHQLARPAADDLALEIARVVREVEEEFSLSIHLAISDGAAEGAMRLREPTRRILLKVTREALVNAAKHGGRCRATVRLATSRNGRIVLAIADDGTGFATRNGSVGHGLTSLRKAVRTHGGVLRVRSTAGSGTRVTLSLESPS